MAESLHYLDFEIEIGIGSGLNYPVSVRSSAGETHATMLFPFDQVVLESRLITLQNALLHSSLQSPGYASEEEQVVRQFGSALYNALLAGRVGQLYAAMRQRADDAGAGLRLKLNILDPGLAALPWEFLYDADLNEYPGLSPYTPVVRYLSLSRPLDPLTITPPLRILGMIANPNNLPALNTEREKLRVERSTKALRDRGLVELHWVDGQTPQALQRTLWGGPWHVWHFIGHGTFDRQLDEGIVMFADAEGEAQRFAASQLARLLSNHHPLRLIVLNSCESAHGSAKDLFSSTAATLVQQGLPAVLAMQYEITDTAAIEFSTTFYDALAEGFPVDTAVAEARTAVNIRPDTTLEWGTPVLYMRSPDGVLFHMTSTFTAPSTPVAPSSEPNPPITTSNPQTQVADLMAQLVDAESRKDWDTAIAVGNKILVLNPNCQPARMKTATSYQQRGMSYYDKRAYDQAIADFNHAIQLDPTNANYYYLRGVSYAWKGEHDQAIADHTYAMELDPNNARYYRERGVSYYLKGAYDQAIADLNHAIELAPTISDYYYSRGLSYQAKKDREDARRDFEQAAKMGHVEAKKELG